MPSFFVIGRCFMVKRGVVRVKMLNLFHVVFFASFVNIGFAETFMVMVAKVTTMMSLCVIVVVEVTGFSGGKS